MAIQFGGNRNVAQPVTRNSQPITRNVTQIVHPADTALRVEALEREVAALRKLIADMSGPSANKRAAYMREYRKRSKS
jgi:uncharacterized protein YceH (UPF0502 family)